METTSTAFQEGFAAFPFERRDKFLRFSAAFSPGNDATYCPYRKPDGQRYEKQVQESEWAQWWRGYRMAAAADEEEFLTTKEYK